MSDTRIHSLILRKATTNGFLFAYQRVAKGYFTEVYVPNVYGTTDVVKENVDAVFLESSRVTFIACIIPKFGVETIKKIKNI